MVMPCAAKVSLTIGQWFTGTQSMNAIVDFVRFMKGMMVLRSPRAISFPSTFVYFLSCFESERRSNWKMN